MIVKRYWTAFNTDEYCTLTFEQYRHIYERYWNAFNTDEYFTLTFERYDYRHDYEAILHCVQYRRVLDATF